MIGFALTYIYNICIYLIIFLFSLFNGRSKYELVENSNNNA